MTATEPKPQRQRSPVWMRVVLAISLALNFAIIGMIVGAFIRFGGPPSEARAPAPVLGALVYRELPLEERRALRRSLADMPSSVRNQQRVGLVALTQIIRKDPFDPEAAAEILERGAERREIMQAAAFQIWSNRVSAMSIDERIAYADRLVEAFENRNKNTRPKDKPGK